MTKTIKTFRKGTAVQFTDHLGREVSGTFIRRFSPAPRAGAHYEIQVGSQTATIFAQGLVGRSLVKI